MPTLEFAKTKLGYAIATVAVVAGVGSIAGAQAANNQPPNPNPTGYSKDQCKNGGYQALGFRNQGQCVSFFASGGKSAH